MLKRMAAGVVLVTMAGCAWGQMLSMDSQLMGRTFTCEHYDFETGKASGCVAAQGASLTDIISELTTSQRNHQNQNTACGKYADWTVDQNGNVMYRVPNATCPEHPKPIGYGNYCARDLEAIGKSKLPNGARPRTLGCKQAK